MLPSLQYHENAGFCETNWRPLAEGPAYSKQRLEAPDAHTLPPIVGSEIVVADEFVLSAPVQHMRPETRDTQRQHSRPISDQSYVRTVADERPVARQNPPAKRYRLHDASQQVQEHDADDRQYDYYAP